MQHNRPFCLSIAGLDPTAGAGVLADIKSFEMLDVYGMAIITSNTLQTDMQFMYADWIDTKTIVQQILNLFKQYNFNALKIGLVENYEMLYRIISTVKNIQPDIHIIWDPILKSSSGFNFHSKASLELDFLENNCTLITPNWPEFETLWGSNIDILKERNPKAAILIKGGHRKEKTGCDLLFEQGNFSEIQGVSFNGKSKHGTGCVLSAAITAHLANGLSLADSCQQAKTYVENLILSNNTNLGYHHVQK